MQIVSSDWLVQLLVARGVASGQLGLQVKWNAGQVENGEVSWRPGRSHNDPCGRGRFNQRAKSKLNLHMS